MLRSITLRNLATISDASMEFQPGLNIITGETGSGKSILVDGLMLASGARADTSIVRPGCRTGSVEALFQGHGGETLVRREISSQGRSRTFIDDSLATLEEVRNTVQGFLELHSQRSTPVLLKQSRQLDLLDRYAGTLEDVEEYREGFSRLRSALAEKQGLRDFLAESSAKRDMIHHEQKLLGDLAPDPDDYRMLAEEENSLAEAMTQADLLAEVSMTLDGEQGMIPTLVRLSRKIKGGSPEALQLEELLEQARIALEESSGLLSRRLSSIELAPARLDEIRSRLDSYSRMISRFGGTFDAMLLRAAVLEGQLKEFTDAEERLARIEVEFPSLQTAVSGIAAVLSQKRTGAAALFSRLAQDEMRKLNMPWADFRIELSPPSTGLVLEGRTLDRRGGEAAGFLFSANRGIDPAPLESVASGGELSRVALSIALVLADRGGASTLVFDEIDTGTGGETARKLADSLYRAAGNRQIIVVSHLAQVASRADRHLMVSKDSSSGMPVSKVTHLGDKAHRKKELARLLGGGPGALDHAERLLEQTL